MRLFTKIYILLSFIALTSCDNDDGLSSFTQEEEIALPNIAIVGDDLLTGASFNLVQWTASFENMTTINLQETIGFEFGFLQNTVGTELAFALDFPITSYVFYDVATGNMRSVTDFFVPVTPVNNSYTINAGQSVLTYYLDPSVNCCEIYLQTYAQTSGVTNEVYLGNADISPVQFNVFARGTRSFAVAVDTFTGVRNLFVTDVTSGEQIGVLDVSDYGGFIYNDIRDEMYLFNFNGNALSHVVLDLSTFNISEVSSFPLGISVSEGFNDAQFTQNEMVFKDFNSIISSVYSFDTNTITTYERTDLINKIFEETGRGLSITNTSIDFETRTYVVMGTYMEDNNASGLVVIMSLDREVLLTLETGNVRPQEVLFLNEL